MILSNYPSIHLSSIHPSIHLAIHYPSIHRSIYLVLFSFTKDTHFNSSFTPAVTVFVRLMLFLTAPRTSFISPLFPHFVGPSICCWWNIVEPPWIPRFSSHFWCRMPSCRKRRGGPCSFARWASRRWSIWETFQVPLGNWESGAFFFTTITTQLMKYSEL